jgi:hypothetical protein
MKDVVLLCLINTFFIMKMKQYLKISSFEVTEIVNCLMNLYFYFPNLSYYTHH